MPFQASSSTSSRAAAATVKLGVIAPEGVSTNYPGSQAAAKAAIAGLNARGGLSGHPVELVYCNDKGDPNIATQCARFTPCWLNERAPARAPESA